MKPVSFVIISGLPAFLKPHMLIRTMRRDNVDHQFQPQFMGFANQVVKISHLAIFRVNAAIISNIIAKIFLWRGEKRANPYRIYP